MIETTINMHVETMKLINKISSYHNISRSEVIKILLKRVMNKELNGYHLNKCIQYQDCDSKEKWHKFHILLDVSEYEFFLDLRKFFKKSVSAIVAYAVHKYFKEITKSKFKFTDNYRFKNYIIIKEIFDGVITWKIYWGYTEKIGKILNNSMLE